MSTMNMPGFTADLSLYKASGHYEQSSISTPMAFGVQAALRMTLPAAMGRSGRLTLGVTYPPPDGGCQICDCTYYPFPC
jgi:hypothetical protein